MSTFRYRAVGPDVNRLKKAIDPAVTVAGSKARLMVDVTVTNDDLKTDLDVEMARQGFEYDSTSPADDPGLVIESPDTTVWNVTITDDGDFNTDDGGGGGGDIAKLTGDAPVNVTKEAAAAGTGATAARADHKHDIATAEAVELTDSSNTEGDSTTLARANHTHAHGNRGGGALHASATPSVPGFISTTDKTKLDNVVGVGDATRYATVFVSGDAATSSPSFVDGLAGGSVSPPVDGDYMVLFNGNAIGSTGNTKTAYGISKNSTTACIPDSVRRARGNGGDDIPASTHTVLTGLVTSDVIRVLFRISEGSGTSTLRDRRITLIRVTS